MAYNLNVGRMNKQVLVRTDMNSIQALPKEDLKMVDILDTEKFLQKIDRNKMKKAGCDAILDELEKTRELCIWLNQIIEYAPDGIYVTDGEANAIRINPAFERISGLDREKMLGKNHRELEVEKVV
jgi:PAS domain-containing protein